MSSERMEFITIEISNVKAETSKAFLLVLESTGEEKWVPRATLAKADDDSLYAGMGSCTVRIHDWFARKENLI